MEKDEIKCPNCRWEGKSNELKIVKNSENLRCPSCGLVLTTTRTQLENCKTLWEM